jgi:hypothetical protein
MGGIGELISPELLPLENSLFSKVVLSLGSGVALSTGVPSSLFEV